MSILLLVMCLPAVGAPTFYILQDTLKSVISCLGALAIGVSLTHKKSVYIPTLSMFPALLFLYALFSAIWSHTYLGLIEASRWFVLTIILVGAYNFYDTKDIPRLFRALVLGSSIAVFWCLLQYFFGLNPFPSAASPASTFVNRNFFAEYLILIIPCTTFLLHTTQSNTERNMLAILLGLQLSCIFMTGTRSALLALFICISIFIALALENYLKKSRKKYFSKSSISIFIATILLVGILPKHHSLDDLEAKNALQTAITRTATLVRGETFDTLSVSARFEMWRASFSMITANPIFGVGSGAWEVHLPIYQNKNRDIEIDYYAHNEYLQLISENGLVGAAALLILFCFIGQLFYSLLTLRGNGGVELALLTLCSSLMMFLFVSGFGFPWRLATTGVLFATLLGVASKYALADSIFSTRLEIKSTTLKNFFSYFLLLLFLPATLISGAIAFESEYKLVEASRLAAIVTKSGLPNSPQMAFIKAESYRLASEGTQLNPHYRKLISVSADAFASWGDWDYAKRLWLPLSESRPYVVAILSNISRAYIEQGDTTQARLYLNRALLINPDSDALKGLEVILEAKSGRELQAATMARALLAKGNSNKDLVRAAYFLGLNTGDISLVIQALRAAILIWPEDAANGWLRLGNIYNSPQLQNTEEALDAYRKSLASSSSKYEAEMILQEIPVYFRNRLSQRDINLQ